MTNLLNQYYEFAIELLSTLGICYGEVTKVFIMPKASTRTLGICKRNRDYSGYWDGTFSISLNPCLFADGVNDDIIIQTLLHELIHTVYGCFNHGKKFKFYAQIINNKYGYSISRTTDSSKFGVELPKRKNKFEIVCNNCGAVWHYKRSTRFVQCVERDGGQRWTCGCGAKGQFKCIRMH